MMRSVARQLLWSVGGLSLAVGLVGSLAAFAAFEHELVRQKTAFLSQYVAERANNEARRFSDLAAFHDSAARELDRRLHVLSDAQARATFDREFPLQPDGTRRSAADSFDGHVDQDGDLTYGMGAFLGDGRHVTLQDQKVFVAAYGVVSGFGEAVRSAYDNFYFFTPQNRMVMFGPNRSDRLAYYRRTAPANLDFSHEEMVEISRPGANPGRAIRCTNLQSAISDAQNVRRAIACVTPVDVEGRQLGAFGSSIELSGYLASAVGRTLPRATNLIVNARGDLIAYPGFTRPGVASDAAISGFERRLRLRQVVQQIRRTGDETGVLRSADGETMIAYGRLKGPDWYFLLTYPRSALVASAAKSASWVLLLGVLSSVMMTALVVVLSRKHILKPLGRLAGASIGGGEDCDVSDIEARTDAIGGFARTLRAEREKVADLLSSLEERVRARTAELEHANMEKSRFLANMSHELRTPLNGVVAVSEMLASEQTDARGRELAELVVSSGKLLEQVLTDILDYSKLEAGRMQLHVEAFDLDKAVGQIAALHGAVADKKDVQFRLRIAPDAKGCYLGDSVRITQILSNLLSNATKFTEAGQVTLDVACAGEAVVFAVEDTGVGFDEETGRRLFQRFEQADASVTRRYGGAGLGLSICAALTEIMGGEISATSIPGKGSRFEVRLPLPRAEQAAAIPEQVTQETGGGVERLRVLLAEDHPTNQRVVTMILEGVGAELTVVENGRDAVAAWEAQTFDVVLMDMQMPEMDGLSATAAIRGREHDLGRARTPVIMLTANAMDEHVAAGRAAGADLHVSKPMRPQALLAAIGQVVDAAARDAEHQAA